MDVIQFSLLILLSLWSSDSFSLVYDGDRQMSAFSSSFDAYAFVSHLFLGHQVLIFDSRSLYIFLCDVSLRCIRILASFEYRHCFCFQALVLTTINIVPLHCQRNLEFHRLDVS